MFLAPRNVTAMWRFLCHKVINNQRKGHLQGCFFDFKEREDDTMTHTIRGPPTGKAYMLLNNRISGGNQ